MVWPRVPIELRLACPRYKTFALKCLGIGIGIILLMCLQTITKNHGEERRTVEELRVLHDVLAWPSRQSSACGGNFTGYANKFFRMKSPIYMPETDTFQLACKNEKLPPQYHFIDNDYGVGKYILRIHHVTDKTQGGVVFQDGVTVIVDRCNAHNYYHNMQEWYNLFLISKFFNYDFGNLQVFVIDRSLDFHTDIHWKVLFPKLTRAKEVRSPVQFQDALFNIAGPGNPWGYYEYGDPPYVEEFTRTFLSIFSLDNKKVLNCANLTITLYIRRNYFFLTVPSLLHKRNTQRKFKNEQELVKTLKKGFPGHTIRTIIAEDITLKEQLELIVDTDILVGMHGCVFTNALFMPKHSGIFEMYPKYWDRKPFFSDIAKWRGIKYGYWRNEQKENEFPDYQTYVPPEVLLTNVYEMRKTIGCGS